MSKWQDKPHKEHDYVLFTKEDLRLRLASHGQNVVQMRNVRGQDQQQNPASDRILERMLKVGSIQLYEVTANC
jgi:hypothetical protein